MRRHRMRGKLLWTAFLAGLVAFWLSSGEAEAQRRRVYYVYRPYPEKAGLFMMNFRGGPAFGVARADYDLRFLGMFGLDLGFAVDPAYNAYIILTPQLQFREGFYNVAVPIGFQYDIRVARGLYLYPRASIGYAAQIYTSSIDVGPVRYYTSSTVHGGMLIPEFGLKYVVNGRLNLGFEPSACRCSSTATATTSGTASSSTSDSTPSEPSPALSCGHARPPRAL